MDASVDWILALSSRSFLLNKYTTKDAEIIKIPKLPPNTIPITAPSGGAVEST
jgi:hypothetical protein